MRATKSFAILLGAALAGTPAVAQVVGKAAAVNANSTVSGRTLTIGASVLHKERIQTNTSGSLQLLFIDRTTLTVGPNSNIVIDEYIFDPNKNTGKMTVSVSKGVMRFVGGQISHSGEATVKTPPATIGIRGGVAIIEVNGGKTTATNVYGSLTVTPNTGPAGAGGGTPTSVPQGQTGTAGVAAPVTTAPTSQQQLNATNQQLQSKAGQTGGVSAGASSQAAAVSTQAPSTTSTITPASPPASGSTASGPSSASGAGATSGSSNSTAGSFAGGTPPAVTSTSQASQTSGSNTAAQQTTPPPPPPDPGPIKKP